MEAQAEPSHPLSNERTRLNASDADFTVQDIEMEAQSCAKQPQLECASVDGLTKSTPPIFIEACAGCGILSSVVKARGFKVLPIDCSRNRHEPLCKIFEIDLSKPRSVELLKRICSDNTVLAVHIALPCGTCSKARGIPLADGSAGPPPLRDWGFLYGLPNVSGTDAAKLKSANELYFSMVELIEFLESQHIAWTVENPTNSWLWELPCMAFPLAHGHFYTLHACAFGGMRKKDTAFLSSSDEFHILSQYCDGQHEHLEWGYDADKGVFNTSKEAEYPRKLCECYADALVSLANARGYHLDGPETVDNAAKPHQQRSGRKLPQIVSEYAQVFKLQLKHIPQVDDKKRILQPCGTVPAGSKLLRAEARQGGYLCVLGSFRSMEQFVQVSQQLWHPFDELFNLPDDLIRCIFKMLRTSPSELTKYRIEMVQRWTKYARQLEADEKTLRAKLRPEVRAVLKGKRLLLLEKLANDVDWPDKNLHQELRDGFLLTGYAGPTGIFKTEIRPANLDKQQLMMDAKYLRPLILGKITNQNNVPEDEQALYDLTVDEAANKGWLDGPFDPSEISEQMGGPWLPVRRFGIWQKGKYRPIDDMKENHLNDCFSSCDKVDLGAMDNVLWSLCNLMKFCMHESRMDLKLSDGTRLQDAVHPSWKRQPASFEMTSFDLKSAYKQLPLNPGEYDCTVVSLKDPSSQGVKCFYMRTLPFGSVASVLHFNRTARLLWRLGLSLGIVWGNYFDDFPCISHSLHCTSTLACVQSLFGLLGFAFAEDKLAPFSTRAEMLGVEVDLTQCCNGKICVDNKQSRKRELVEVIDELVNEKKVVPAHLPSILGRMQFADMQISGKLGKLAMADVRELGTVGKTSVALNTEILGALDNLKQRMSSGKPRSLSVNDGTRPFILFTDGAYEHEDGGDGTGTATIGGVLILPDKTAKVFGCFVHKEVLDKWLSIFQHPIGLIELYAVAVAYKLWGHLMSGKRVLAFCDNWTAIDVFIKGSSKVKAWRDLLLTIEKLDQEFGPLVWMARVPSPSNIADPPSRGSIDELSFLHASLETQIICPIVGKLLTNVSFG